MILLTGCSGLIGKNLLAELLQQGKNIRCYDFLKPAGAPQGVSFTGGDLLNEASLAAALDGVHTVFHCLDIKRPGSKGRRYMKKVNVKGTAAILAASKKAGVSRFFFISTHSVYGKKSLVSMLLRGRPWKPVTAYGKDKLKAESLCGEYIRQKSLNITIFRPAPVISPGIKDPAALACLFMALRENGKGKIYISSYSGRRQLLHIGDAVEAILASLESPVSIGQIYDIGSDDVPTHKEEIDALREKAGLDCEVKILSRARIRLYRCLFALAGGHLFTGEHFRSLIASRVTDCRKIKDELNWRPRKGNIDILTETILWYKKEKLKI